MNSAAAPGSTTRSNVDSFFVLVSALALYVPLQVATRDAVSGAARAPSLASLSSSPASAEQPATRPIAESKAMGSRVFELRMGMDRFAARVVPPAFQKEAHRPATKRPFVKNCYG